MTICPKSWIDLTRLDSGWMLESTSSRENQWRIWDTTLMHKDCIHSRKKCKLWCQLHRMWRNWKHSLEWYSILTKSRNDTSATISAATERGSLGMDEEGRSCFPKGQVPLGLLSTTGTLRSQPSTPLGLWCLTIRSRRCLVAHHARWLREACSLCFLFLGYSGEELLPTWQRSISHYLQSKTIPPIHLWKEVSIGIRPQTIDEYPGCTERHSRDDFCKTAVMGTYASCIWLQYCLPSRTQACYCRLSE